MMPTDLSKQHIYTYILITMTTAKILPRIPLTTCYKYGYISLQWLRGFIMGKTGENALGKMSCWYIVLNLSKQHIYTYILITMTTAKILPRIPLTT
jgi:hypothetical protein